MDREAKQAFTFEGYTLDLVRGCLQGARGEIKLRPKCFELLQYLVENPGRLVVKDELAQAVWPNVIVSDDSLAQCISDLRNALNDIQRRIIKTVSRRGYLFAAPVTRIDGAALPLSRAPLGNGSEGLIAEISGNPDIRKCLRRPHRGIAIETGAPLSPRRLPPWGSSPALSQSGIGARPGPENPA
jgi:DNA-binding winged helix-turn-helix (wHTH) protein